MIQYLFSVTKKWRDGSKSQRNSRSGRTLHIEFLEARYVFAAPPPVILENWQSMIFDDGLSGTLPFALARNPVTVDPQGDAVGPNTPRFGNEKLLTEIGSWTPVMSNSDNAEIFGSGWDHDGQTPLAILWDVSHGRMTFIRSYDFTVVNTETFAGLDLLRGEVPGYRYVPQSAIIHEGLVAVITQRERQVGTGWVSEGISFAYTQDYGQTFQRVAQAGGGFDVPAIPGGVTDGISRSRAWAFANAFPEKSADDLLGAWFPWADYLQQSGNPKGGQIGLFRARRAAVGELWEVEPNVTVYETWREEDSGGFHAHTAGMFVDGMASFWGDVSYRNRMVRHVAQDLENYTTTTWTHEEEFHGGWSPNDAPVHLLGNQAGSATPGPNFGEILVTGDEQPEFLMRIERPDQLGEKAIITNLSGSFPGPISGSSYIGRTASFMQRLRGVGYVATEISSLVQNIDALHFSPDGEHWGQLVNLGTSVKYFFGNKIIANYQGNLNALDVPTSSNSMAPLLINPGGQNLATADPVQTASPGLDNQARRVLYLDGVYVYQDTLLPLDVQPDQPPPVMSGMTMWEFTSAGTAGNMGAWQLGNISSASNQLHWLSAWHYSLDGNGISPAMRVGDTPNTERESIWVANSHWVPTQNYGIPNPGSSDPFVQKFRMFNGSDLAPRRWLTAIEGYNQGAAPTYPLAPGASGPNELATATLVGTTATWSTALTFGLPQLSSFSSYFEVMGNGTPHTLATIFQNSAEHIDITFTKNTTTSGVIGIDVYSGGILLDRVGFRSVNFDREDQIRLILSNSPEEFGATLLVTRNGFGIDSKSIVGSGYAIVPGFMRLSNLAGTVVEPMEWFAIQFSPTQALTTDEREIMVGLDYMFERLDAPPVIGPPGFDADDDVDGRDFLIWQRGFGITQYAIREEGDANADGAVDETDLAIWQVGYGLGIEDREPTGDFNQDGFVDGSDLAVWQQGYGTKGTAGALGLGDGDGNGNVDGRDFLLWQTEYTPPAPGSVADESQVQPVIASDEPASASEAISTSAHELDRDSTESSSADSATANHDVLTGPAGDLFGDSYWVSLPVVIWDSKRDLIQELLREEKVFLDAFPSDREVDPDLLECHAKSVSIRSSSATVIYDSRTEVRDWSLDADLAIAAWQTL